MTTTHDLKSAGLKATLPRVRIINLFEQSKVRHLTAEDVYKQCGRVEEFYDAEIERRQLRIAKDRGFEISEHALYLYADCTKPKCPYRK